MPSTGSAGWMYRTAVESILGFSIEDGRWLVINPAISESWPQCRLTYRIPGGRTEYEFTIENPGGKQHGVSSASLDSEPLAIANSKVRVPLVDDHRRHQVVVRL